MWIVRLALRRPYTFVVFALLIVILGVYSILSMPTDIFPNIDIPVVTLVWSYNGLSAEQMANRIVYPSERGHDHNRQRHRAHRVPVAQRRRRHQDLLSSHVNIGEAVAEVSAISQVQLRSLPPGTLPPFIIQYNASSVPILMLGVSGQGLNEQQLTTSRPTPSAPSWLRSKARRRRFPTAEKRARFKSTSTSTRSRPRVCLHRRGECCQCAEPRCALRHHEDPEIRIRG